MGLFYRYENIAIASSVHGGWSVRVPGWRSAGRSTSRRQRQAWRSNTCRHRHRGVRTTPATGCAHRRGLSPGDDEPHAAARLLRRTQPDGLGRLVWPGSCGRCLPSRPAWRNHVWAESPGGRLSNIFVGGAFSAGFNPGGLMIGGRPPGGQIGSSPLGGIRSTSNSFSASPGGLIVGGAQPAGASPGGVIVSGTPLGGMNIPKSSPGGVLVPGSSPGGVIVNGPPPITNAPGGSLTNAPGGQLH